MALTETNAVAEITVLPLENNVQVKWRNTIKLDDQVIAERDHYKLFGPEKYHDFLAEVECAEAYITVLGWVEPEPVVEEVPEPGPEGLPAEEPAPAEPEPEQ